MDVWRSIVCDVPTNTRIHSSLLDAMRRYIKASQVFKGLGSMLIYLCEHTHSLSLSRARLYTYLRTNEFTQIHYTYGSWQCARAFVWSGKTVRQRTRTHNHAGNHTDFILSILGWKASGICRADDWLLGLLDVSQLRFESATRCGVTFSVGRLIWIVNRMHSG